MAEMKHAKEVYEQFEFYEPDEDIKNKTQRIIRTRKPHRCANCQQEISSGENMLLETCFLDGPSSAYTCINCCNKMIDLVEREQNG